MRGLMPRTSLKTGMPRGASGSSDKKGHVPSSGQQLVFQNIKQISKDVFHAISLVSWPYLSESPLDRLRVTVTFVKNRNSLSFPGWPL